MTNELVRVSTLGVVGENEIGWRDSMERADVLARFVSVSIKLTGFDNFRSIMQWIWSHCKSKVVMTMGEAAIGGLCWHFDDPDEAMMFRLTFGGG